MCLFVTASTSGIGTGPAPYLAILQSNNTAFYAMWCSNDPTALAQSTSAGELLYGTIGFVFHFFNQGNYPYYAIDATFIPG
jgi:hypothetical protein